MSNQQPTFQQAMEITATWLQQWDNEEISDEAVSYTHLTLPTILRV